MHRNHHIDEALRDLDAAQAHLRQAQQRDASGGIQTGGACALINELISTLEDQQDRISRKEKAL